MNDLTRPISNRSLLGLTKVILSKKRGCLMDAMCKMTALSIKMAVFMDKVAELMVLSMKRDVFMDERIAQKKRHPRKDVSVKLLRINRLLIKCSSNVNGASNCTTYHWVVTDAEESHHLNVCWY